MSVNSKMTAIADAIRAKTGETSTLTLDEMAEAITGIEVGITLPELANPGSASDLLSGKELIDSDGNVVTGTMTNNGNLYVTIADFIETNAIEPDDPHGALIYNIPEGYHEGEGIVTISKGDKSLPTISVNSSGLITAVATTTAGYVTDETKTGTKQLTTQSTKTITPTKSSQTAVASGVYTTGTVTVAAIPNQYIITTDATASADEIMSGETAYVNGSKVTGTFSIDSELSAQDDLITQIQAAVNNLPEAGSGDSGGSGNKEPCTVTISDSFGFGLYCTYISSIDDNAAMFYVNYDGKTINAYKNDVLTVVAIYSQASNFEEIGCTTIESNCSYVESLNEDGNVIAKFSLTEDSNIIVFSDEEQF